MQALLDLQMQTPPSFPIQIPPEWQGQIPATAVVALLVLEIVLGLVFCFFGYRVFKAILALYGLVIGATFAGMVAHIAGGQSWAVFLAAAAGGIVGAVLFVVLYYVAIFLLGAGAGVGLAMLVAALSHTEPNTILMGIAATVCGTLTLIFRRFVIIVLTASSGASMIVAGVGGLVTSIANPVEFSQHFTGGTAIALAGGSVLLMIAGILVQYLVTGKKKEGEKEGEGEGKKAAA